MVMVYISAFCRFFQVLRSSGLRAPPRGIAWSPTTPSRISPKASGVGWSCWFYDEKGELRGFNPCKCVTFTRESCLLASLFCSAVSSRYYLSLSSFSLCQSLSSNAPLVSESKIVEQELSTRQIGLLENMSILKNTLSQIEEYFKTPMCPPTANPSREVVVIL